MLNETEKEIEKIEEQPDEELKPKRAPFHGNRTVIGIICIVLAVILVFVIAPLLTRVTQDSVQVIRIASNIERGSKIRPDDLEVVFVRSDSLPSGILNDPSAIIGKYAETGLHRGNYIYPDQLSSQGWSAENAFASLDGSGKVAISITVRGFASGLSNKLQNSDVVSLIVTVDGRSFIPGALQYMRIVTTTTSNGLDRDEVSPDESGQLPQYTTMTFLVTEAQAKLLTRYEQSGAPFTAVLVYRTASGNEDKAGELLAKQDKWLKECESLTDPYSEED